MGDFRVKKLEAGQTKIRNVPIAVTPEGFWCCPSPVVLQKTLKHHPNQAKHKSMTAPPPPPPPPPPKSSARKTPTEKKPVPTQSRTKAPSDDQRNLASEVATMGSERTPKSSGDIQQHRKISVGFGQPDTSDLKVILSGKEAIAVRMSVHRSILVEHSKFFAEKLSRQSPVTSIELGDCDDVEIYVETVGLMYCKEVKQRLIKQSVPRVLRILKDRLSGHPILVLLATLTIICQKTELHWRDITFETLQDTVTMLSWESTRWETLAAEYLGFNACINSCLEYLEAVPWVGEEEDNVVSLLRHLPNSKFRVSPILRRVSSDISNPPNDALARILDLVLKSNEDRGRLEMKSLVLKLLRENSLLLDGSVDICVETLYASCQSCLHSLLLLFKQASEPGFSDKSLDSKDPITRQLTLEVDNLLWLIDILADRRVADEFAVMWASQDELAGLHPKLPIVSRHVVSRITARLFVGIGKGEMLPSKETRQLLLNVWLQPLIDDYNWIQHSCRSFDRKVVEEGIGQTILTLPLEDQQTILLSWLGSFLKVGGNCPNLQRAFEVWWRRTFIKPHLEQQENFTQSDRS